MKLNNYLVNQSFYFLSSKHKPFTRSRKTSKAHDFSDLVLHSKIYCPTCYISFQNEALQQFPRVTVTNNHEFNGFKHRNLFSYNSGKQKFKIRLVGAKVSAGRASWLQRRIYYLPLPSSGGCWHSLACGHVIAISASLVLSPTPVMQSNFSLSLSYKNTWDSIQGLLG